MNNLIVKRMNKELGENWEIISVEEPKIQFYHNGIPLIVKLRDYPFKPPRFENWPHERYYNVVPFIEQQNIRGFIGTRCLYCKIYDDWSPSCNIQFILNRFIQLDKFISNCVKLNFVFQNKLELPEDMLHIIWSYLN
jgi:hypothetical protein